MGWPGYISLIHSVMLSQFTATALVHICPHRSACWLDAMLAQSLDIARQLSCLSRFLPRSVVQALTSQACLTLSQVDCPMSVSLTGNQRYLMCAKSIARGAHWLEWYSGLRVQRSAGSAASALVALSCRGYEQQVSV